MAVRKIFTPIDPLIQHIVKKDPKLWEALKALSNAGVEITDAVLNQTVSGLIDFYRNSALVGSQPALDLKEGTGISISVVNDLVAKIVRYTIAQKFVAPIKPDKSKCSIIGGVISTAASGTGSSRTPFCVD